MAELLQPVMVLSLVYREEHASGPEGRRKLAIQPGRAGVVQRLRALLPPLALSD